MISNKRRGAGKRHDVNDIRKKGHLKIQIAEHMKKDAWVQTKKLVIKHTTEYLYRDVFAVAMGFVFWAGWNFMKRDPDKVRLFNNRVNFCLNIVRDGRILETRTVYECSFKDVFPARIEKDFFHDYKDECFLRQKTQFSEEADQPTLADDESTGMITWFRRVERKKGSPFICVPRRLHKNLCDHLINRLSMLFSESHFKGDVRGARAVKSEEYIFALTYEKEDRFDITPNKQSAKGNEKFRLLIVRRDVFETHFGTDSDSVERSRELLEMDEQELRAELSDSTDDEEALNKLKVAELRTRCEANGLSTDGRKSELVERLVASSAPAMSEAEMRAKLSNGGTKLRWEGCPVYNKPCTEHSASRCNVCHPGRCGHDTRDSDLREGDLPCMHSKREDSVCYGADRIFHLRLLREELEMDKETRDKVAKGEPHGRWLRGMFDRGKFVPFDLKSFVRKGRKEGGPLIDPNNPRSMRESNSRIEQWSENEIPLVGRFYVTTSNDTPELDGTAAN